MYDPTKSADNLIRIMLKLVNINTASSECELQARREGGGCDGCVRTPPTPAEVHLFVDQRFCKLELGTLLKGHDDQHCWSSWFAAANPMNNTDFQFISIFVLFKKCHSLKLQNTYIKLSLRQKNQFWSLTVWVISTFLSSLLAACFTSYCLQNAQNAFSDNLIFKIFRGEHATAFP